ncbi:MAG: YceI family protein, partial [Gemmatimonadaceae bacterium]|nr:YceI family protein [Gemmatimonadaceae bacterium]
MASSRSWRLDRSNTRVTFRVRWFGVLRVSGWFRDIEGDLTLPDANGGAVMVDVRVAGGSVRTGIGLRDRHLRGPRFLDAASHPVIRFSSARANRDNGRWQVAGTLQLRGKARALS